MGRLILGDCLAVLPTIPSCAIDLVLTDPPYLVNYVDRSGRSIANDVRDDWLLPAFSELQRVMRPDSICVSFYGWSAVDRFFAAWKAAGFRIVGHMVFSKGYSSRSRYVKYQHESAYILAKGNPALPTRPLPDVMPWGEYTGNRLHPTQKPVGVLTQIVEAFSRPNDIVLDPFAGSGSTCEAAHNAGRRYVGIELDATYHAAADRRLKALTLARAA
ncbi:putative methylase YubD (plasmid) [Paraburkholderia kururiensis]|uniref:DNA methyltransferase n=1 Tax=Paraburkholderia kururiensis TaxID=984307 RepID=UPI0039A492C3